MTLEYWNKAHICGLLSIRFGLMRYLEITTSTTGFRYAEARQLNFQPCMRLVYRATEPPPDGLPVDFTSVDDDIAVCLNDTRLTGQPFDIIFVDPHHTYECSARDIQEAFRMVAPGGAVVVHDCLPPSRAAANPSFIHGEWCGATYKAYIDFVLGNPDLDYFTIDADYGCGVILKPTGIGAKIKNWLRARRVRALKDEWHAVGNDFDAAFDKFMVDKVRLLRLVDFRLLRSKLS
jgi:SAM-dependent methyltransferase